MITPATLINRYNMMPHPEGGHYIQTWQSNEKIKKDHLPGRFTGDRHFCTAIYFLLEEGEFSAFHRIKSDECWHFYAGNTLLIYEINHKKELTITKLGADIANGELFQHIVPAGTWFASEPAPGSSFSFVGCTVAPGFDFEDFEMATARELVLQFPRYRATIERICK